MAEKRTQNSETQHLKKSLFKNGKPINNSLLAARKKPTSLSSLILWNVSKALENNPKMDIKRAIKAAHERLADSHDMHAAICKTSEHRHFTCAVLAWQQLGHSDMDSLHHFIEAKIKEKEEERNREKYSLRSNESPPVGVCVCESHLLTYSKGVLSASFGSDSVGPVIKLPVDTKIVMRAEGKSCKNCQANNCQAKKATRPAPVSCAAKPRVEVVSSATKTKIDYACPKSRSCDSRLTCLDKEIDLLRNRAAMLAKREKDRVELLQRAEQAWLDLERGYQRQLMLSEEKEEDLIKQKQKATEERDACKNSCNLLTKELQSFKENNEAQSTALSDLEKQLCELSCQKLKVSEESAKTDSELAEYHCKTSQLDRDIQFKEGQARRKINAIQNDLESSQTITNETERVIRAELCALKVQVEQVSKQLLEEDAQNTAIIEEIRDLREEKMGMVEDLEGCQVQCDSRMQGKMDELKKKQEQYAKLNEKVTECRCKMPVDKMVEVKRTASLAALCHCNPEDKVLKSCSCTSMRSRLMSSLLSDLFSGLQSEMGGAGQQMPCQMLKCLEDKHNWDKASVVKTNLENYFDKLLIGELDIAIATSIEKYHAKWVGTICADNVTHKSQENEWQQRAIERRAQNLAQGLAEQLFEQRAEELEQRAKEIITSGPPPCECTPVPDNQNTKPGGKCRDEAAFPVLTNLKLCKFPPHKVTTSSPTRRGAEPIPRMSWRAAMQDVTKLKEQIECLNKESIKKADLKRMEENITRIMQQSSSVVSEIPANIVDNAVLKDMTAKKELKNKKVAHIVEPEYYIHLQRSMTQNKSNIKPKTPKPILKQSSNENGNSSRIYKKLGQNYAINMCMCSQKRAKKKLLNSEVDAEKKDNKTSKNNLPSSSVKQTKPIDSNLQSQSKSKRKCAGVCFHKAPSTSSIDQLLETLSKWNRDHSSSENDKEFCSLLPGGCPIGIAMNQQNEDKYVYDDEKLESNNAIGKISSQSKYMTGQIEGSRSQSDGHKSSEIKKRPSNDIDIDESSIIMNSVQKTSSKKSVGSKFAQLSIKDEAGVLPPTETSQLNTETEKHSQSRSSNSDSVIKKITSDGIDKDKNIKPFDNKRDIAELPIRDTDVMPPTESKYMGEVNLDKSVEEVCKCSKCNNLTNSTEALLPCLCKHKIYLKTMKDKSGDQYNAFSDKPVPIGDTKTNATNESIKMQRDSKTEKKCFDIFLEDKKINGNNVPIGDTKTNSENKSIKMQQDGKTKNPNDSYDIKFLGVTLTDVNSQNQEHANKQYIVGEKKGSAINDKDITINREMKSTDPIVMTMETKEEAGDQGDTQSVKESTSRDFTVNLHPDYKFSIETKRETNEDKGLSIQNFEDQKQDTPCVCCSYKNMDGSKDLEENTFHLLEEHLKNKLQEFKQTSCNDTCIPSEDEEKLFTAILSRVKKVITEGTNKISCKCSKEEETSQGSWNRAYGLLQEYLKTKIKRVQCSCVLAEENNDTILPDVLDKVYHLIEYDFKRLQDICGCKMALEPRNSRVCFKEELPERDEDFQNGLNTGIYSDVPENAPTLKRNKENNSNGYEMFSNNFQNLEAQQNIVLDKDSIINNDDRLFGVQETKPSANKKRKQKYNLPFAGCDCICTNFECSVNGLPDNNSETEKKVFSGKGTSILNHTNIQVGPSEQLKISSQNIQVGSSDELKRLSQNLNKETEPLVNIASKADKIADTDLLYDTNPQFDSINKTEPKCTCCSCTNKTTPLSLEGGFRPYIGYTIDCSCDAALGPCYCSRSVFRDKRYDMDNIFRKSLPEQKEYDVFDYKVEEGFTMDKNALQTESLSEMVNGDLFLHKILHNKSSNLIKPKDCETDASICEADGLILKDSREYFTKTHNQTNTRDDMASLATDSSPHACGSHMYRGVSQSSHSYYNPDYFENSVDTKNENTTASSSEFQEKCSCDMVPICHVKMLVENIENRLVTSNCTCDSMIPQVCPIHSMIPQGF